MTILSGLATVLLASSANMAVGAVQEQGAAGLPGFPQYADLAGKGAYTVTYDKRSLIVAGKPALFMSGAIHPPRGTPAMWGNWFRLAKTNGLNMVQVYIFWNYHEPEEGVFDFSGRGNLTLFMSMAQDAGIFVNLRIGPYVCAEWTYGGIPAWLGQKEGVMFRQSNAVWQPAMEKWFRHIVNLMAQGSFFATQGGPIVLVQVENELPHTDQGYVDWCGTMAASALSDVKVDVPVTMCNGATAKNTINTCNGQDCTRYLENHGQNGRILIDQPGLWTENEGGFQTWGGAPPPGKEPYFWGRSMADQAQSVMKWFARGGSHMNYYMWTGGNNYGRWTGDSITHMYAVDAIVCPDSLPHEPKFSHTTAMHNAIAAAAADIAGNEAQLDKGADLGSNVTAFAYGQVAFLERSSKGSSGGRSVAYKGHTYTLDGNGACVLVNTTTGKVLFDTNHLGQAAQAAQARQVAEAAGGQLAGWKVWKEPTLAKDVPKGAYPAASVFTNSTPLEMTVLTSARTTFAYYEADVPSGLLRRSGAGNANTTLSIPTYESSAFSAYVNGVLVGTADDHTHGNGNGLALAISFDPAVALAAAAKGGGGGGGATSTLTLVSEELGYANYGFKEQLKKGLSGAPKLNGQPITGATWRMRGGLAGEHLQLWNASGAPWVPATAATGATPGTWLQTTFAKPASVSDDAAGQQLFLHATGLSRGRFWVNSHEVGRYWTKPRNDNSACPNGQTDCPTQQYYHIPAAWLNTGSPNTITIFETLGATDYTKASLAVSSMGKGPAVPEPDVNEVASCAF